MTAIERKTKLLQYCKNQVDARYSKIKQTIANIEESLFEESKNSNGDKHETGRAMLQIDRENAGKQLFEIEKLLGILKKIDIKTTSEYVRLGSLVRTDKYSYFIGLSLGTVSIQNKDYRCVALNSPIGLLISGKKMGDGFNFNGEAHTILEVE